MIRHARTILICLLAGLLFLAGVAANSGIDGRHYDERMTEIQEHALSASRRIVCDTPEGQTFGTGFFISSNRMVTAAHVVSDGVCFIEGVGAASIVEINPDQDFALIQPVALFPGEIDPPSLLTSCREVTTGHLGYSTGFARGHEFTVLRGRLINGSPGNNTLTVLSIRGMSGGPVIEDTTDRVIGWVISISPSLTLTNIGNLNRTSICQ